MIVSKIICDNCKKAITSKRDSNNNYHQISYRRMGINSGTVIKAIERDICDDCFENVVVINSGILLGEEI